MNKLNVQIVNGYDSRSYPNSISFQKIEIEPESFTLCIENRDYPIDVLKDIASQKIALQILSKLKYETEKKYDGKILHKFSIFDYSILESKEKEQIINNLNEDVFRLNKLLEKSKIRYNNLLDIFNFNNRKFAIKLKDWILYDKCFNKNLGD